jgi:hypothetical protein
MKLYEKFEMHCKREREARVIDKREREGSCFVHANTVRQGERSLYYDRPQQHIIIIYQNASERKSDGNLINSSS